MCEHRFIVVKGQWTTSMGQEGVICVFAPNDLHDRRQFFVELARFC